MIITGILQVEAEGIQDYECPKCNPKSALNLANLKQLKSHDLDVIKKLFKQIQNSKHSVPFKKPMEKRTNKKYYELVKEPMGKQLCHVVVVVTIVFSCKGMIFNCRM